MKINYKCTQKLNKHTNKWIHEIKYIILVRWYKGVVFTLIKILADIYVQLNDPITQYFHKYMKDHR